MQTKKHHNSTKRTSSTIKKSTNKILEILTIFARFYTVKKDKIHIMAYNKAIRAIKSIGRPIKSLDDVRNVPAIGKGMLEKIDIILRTGTHPKLDEMLSYISTTSSELTDLMGFGTSLISLLKRKYGITNLAELDAYLALQSIPEMSSIALLGWKYRNDLSTLIPRAETTQFFDKFKKIVESKNSRNIKLEVQLAGSYPSGKLLSKDIDIVAFYTISSRNTKKANIMDILVECLQLASDNEGDNSLEIVMHGSTKFIGLVKTRDANIYRHIDIALYPSDIKPYAILYFTSGKIANQIIREKAKKMGYKLNEFGLFNRKTGEKINIAEPIIENLYKLLGVG